MNTNMKKIPTRKLFQAIIMLVLQMFAVSLTQSQESVPYLLSTGQKLELVGFPVHQPALDTGVVQSVAGTLISWAPSYTERPFGSALVSNQEYYAEIVGPANHPWAGHRMELDEAATRARTDHGLITTASSLNTRGLPDITLAGAQLEIRQHLTVPGLWGEMVKNQILYGGDKSSAFSFSFSGYAANRTLIPSIQGSVLSWIESKEVTSVAERGIIPPGSAVGVVFGGRHGSALGFTGMARTWPTATPLQAGNNLLAYPYSTDMRLGLDWGGTNHGFRGLSRPSPNQDRIDLLEGTKRQSFYPEKQSNGTIRWRQADPVFFTTKWALPASYLDVLPAGQGFIFVKKIADPKHFFYPPQK
jgi:hypothetical protein